MPVCNTNQNRDLDITYLVKYDPSALALRVSSSGGTNGSASAVTTYPVASVDLSL